MACTVVTGGIEQSCIGGLGYRDGLRLASLHLRHTEPEGIGIEEGRCLEDIDGILVGVAEIDTDGDGDRADGIPVLMGINGLATHHQGIEVINKFLFGGR